MPFLGLSLFFAYSAGGRVPPCPLFTGPGGVRFSGACIVESTQGFGSAPATLLIRLPPHGMSACKDCEQLRFSQCQQTATDAAFNCTLVPHEDMHLEEFLKINLFFVTADGNNHDLPPFLLCIIDSVGGATLIAAIISGKQIGRMIH